MYKVIMVSGPVKHDFQGGFETELAAFLYAEEYNFRWIDEAGFEWRLEIEEDDEYYSDLAVPNETWAEQFIEFRRHGDDIALQHLSDVFENEFTKDQRLKYTAIRRLVDSLLELNAVVAMMEWAEIPEDKVIMDAYATLMDRLEAIVKQ